MIQKKVVSRFEVIEGLRGFTVEDISLTLLDYSYHFLNNSGRRQPFVTVQCRIDISKFEKEAEKLREYLQSTGRRAPVNIELPDSERTILGILDDSKDEFITLVALPKSVKPVVQFADLRKNKPEYMIFTFEPNENCTDCNMINALSTVVFGFDEQNKTYSKVLEVKTYRAVDAQDDLTSGSGYIDRARVSWSDWINNKYRELIISTERKILGPNKNVTTAFKNKKEIYSWVNDKELALVERVIDGKSTMNRRGRSMATAEITLKDGELYEMRGQEAGSKITSTDGKIDEYLLSPDKRYVAYSVVVGYREDAGDSEDAPIVQVSVHHIVVMDLELKKQLTEIKPPTEYEPFIHMRRWTSNEELLLFDADTIAVGRKYIYNAGTNELRQSDLQEMDL